MKHAPVDEAALYIDPSAVHIESFVVASVGDETMRVRATVDVHVQDGISGEVTVELGRWEPSRGRVVDFED